MSWKPNLQVYIEALPFLIFINDIANNIGTNIRTNIQLFADDTSLYNIVEDPLLTA